MRRLRRECSKLTRWTEQDLDHYRSRQEQPRPKVKDTPKPTGSTLERDMGYFLNDAGIVDYQLEWRFHTTRRWRFDFAWPDKMLALEVEGGTWINGAHTRGRHYESDCVKYNEAALAGWRVIRATSDMVHDGRALSFIQRALKCS